MQSGSFSIAITLSAPRISSDRVSPPGPGPISTTVEPLTFATLVMRWVRLESSKKCWPSDFFAESWYLDITLRSGGSFS